MYVATEKVTPSQQQILDADLALASSLSICMEQVAGRDIAHALSAYAREHQVTEIIIGHSGRTAVQEFVQSSIINKLIRLVRGIDVLVVNRL